MSFKNAKNSSFLENRAAHHARFATSGSSVIGLYFQKMLHWYFQYLMYFERAAVIRFYLSLNLKSEVVDKKKIKYFCSFQHLFKHFITHFWLNLISSWGFFLGFISKFCWSFISHVTWIKFTISSTWHNCSWWRFQQHWIASKLCQKHASQNTGVKWLNTTKHNFLLRSFWPSIFFQETNESTLKIDYLLNDSIRNKSKTHKKSQDSTNSW